jgi:hypothetical protein
MRTGIGVRFMSSGDPHGPEIEEFLRHEFPQTAAKAESVMEAVVDAIIGSRQVRLGAAPNPESLVAIREVARNYIRENRPVPIMIPAGPKKPMLGVSVDMAELSALRILAQLQETVRQHYAPGLDMRLRLEDFTGFYLEGPEIKPTVDRYVADFEALISILWYSGFITPIRERALVGWEEFFAKVSEINALMLPYLAGTDGTEGTMDGWPLASMMKVPVVQAQREFLLGRYAKLYPEGGPENHLRAMAAYLSCAVGRRHLKASGADESWNHGRIDIYFAPPVQGTPHELVSTRVYYRTVPLAHSKQHIPFWRAKGILKVSDDGPRMSFAPWRDADVMDGSVEFKQGEKSVVVKADYVVEE